MSLTEVAREPAADQAAAARRRRVVLITGMSGAGRSTALKALEDIGYEAVDNLPLKLLPALVGEAGDRPVAVGIDTRTRDFAIAFVIDELDALRRDPAFEVRLVFLDCEDEVLRRRFTETRRRHPLALDRPVTDGIARERQLLAPLRDRADQVIDTSGLAIGDLRRLLQAGAGPSESAKLAVFVVSFAYRNGLPRDADLVFDVRFLRNPHYVPELKPRTGRDAEVRGYVEADPAFAPWFERLTQWLRPLLPRFEEEGKSYLTIGIGCTGGRHRSVTVAERLAAWFAAEGRRAELRHRDIESEAA
ncbi:MAG: glmZ(sRNA)-inactivating NTPase [Rhodospirillales bacterium]|nr:glmZ(sRNA)-inactivating NTPase [Rhodospirillales bacterium]